MTPDAVHINRGPVASKRGRIDLTGLQFGSWTIRALHPKRSPQGELRWLCICVCGRERAVCGNRLRSGKSKSCGGCGRLVHGHARKGRVTRVYAVWQSMMQRCYNPNHPSFPNYGGRGIYVCERWHSFVNFLADMGEPPPGLSIDRGNNDAGYSPDNCEWATRSQQQRNQRRRKEGNLRIKRGDPKVLAGLKQLTESLSRAGART